jgi:hypothetical protein
VRDGRGERHTVRSDDGLGYRAMEPLACRIILRRSLLAAGKSGLPAVT